MADKKRFISSKLVYRGKSGKTKAYGIPLQSGFYGPDDTLEIQPTDEIGKHLTGPGTIHIFAAAIGDRRALPTQGVGAATMHIFAATIGDPVADAPEKQQPEKRHLSVTLIYRMEQPYDGDNPRYGCCIPAVNGARHNWDVVDVWPCDENGAIHPGFNVSPVPVSASVILEPFRTAPGYGDDDEWPVCDVCGQPVDPDEAHWGHEKNCTHELLGVCFCNLKYHPACCPDCKNGNCEDEDECEVQA